MYTHPGRVHLSGYAGLGLSVAMDIPATVGMDPALIFASEPLSMFAARYGLKPPGPGFRFLGTKAESAIGTAQSTQRYWNVYVHPATGQWVRQLFTTWAALSVGPDPVPAGAPSPQYPFWTPATEAARRAPGALGTGAWLKEPAIWDSGVVLYDTAAWRLGQRVILADDPVADTLKLVQSLDAGGPPVVESLGFVVEPLPQNWIDYLWAEIAGTLPAPAPAPAPAPRPVVYLIGGEYKDASGATISSADVAKIFPPPPISPTVVKAVAGTTAAIVTAYGGGPGTSLVAPTTGLNPVGIPLTPAETAKLVAQEVATAQQAAAVAAAGGSGMGSPLVWVGLAAAAFILWRKKRG